MARGIREYIKLIFSPFSRAHTIFVSGSAIVMLFPLISAPIVARLYAPEDYGVYAVFFSLATILSAISSLELRNVALLEPNRIDGAHGAILALSVVTLFSISVWGVLLIVPDTLLVVILNESVIPYLIWLPVSVFLMGISQVLYTWATREKEYKVLARNKLILGMVTMIFQICIGLMGVGPIGFIFANLMGLLISTIMLATIFIKVIQNLRPQFSVRSAALQFGKYYRLTVWTMPGSLMNSLSQFLPDLVISRFHGVAMLGQFSLAVRVINMPIAFLAASIQDFFRQQASEEFNEYGHCKSSFWRFLALGLMCAIFLILPIIIMVPYIFPIVFGSQWGEAGVLVQAVAFLTVVRFISSPLSYVWIVKGQQKLDFFWQIGLLVIGLLSLMLPPYFSPEASLYATLWIYSLTVGAWYLLAIVISYRISTSSI